MRVITGAAKGRKILTLDGEDVRPTGERVKEALFSIIQFDLEGRSVLDLFAGSGQLGIEALSRGAKSAVFVDQNKKAVEAIKNNLTSTQLEKNSIVKNMDSLSFLMATKDVFDLAFLDPPFNTDLLAKALPLLSERMAAGSIAVCEHPKEMSLPDKAGNLKCDKEYIYGRTKLTIYRWEEV
ncbi:MAG: 16S rRNA (guanine(966)-N(2))-methyltransferase RsmD [Oscillospiraceae bacterium]|jgi:16S rRNA (guanine(966)-N(2))-methyltransferase RsmD|nr:16S rRNA (guanine(966)-N(2))-methyltransferase RsmD [Oscillospiraceae bacterium]